MIQKIQMLYVKVECVKVNINK